MFVLAINPIIGGIPAIENIVNNKAKDIVGLDFFKKKDSIRSFSILLKRTASLNFLLYFAKSRFFF
jgi:hypothetical protein